MHTRQRDWRMPRSRYLNEKHDTLKIRPHREHVFVSPGAAAPTRNSRTKVRDMFYYLGRAERIRTSGPADPIRVRYQTAPPPELLRSIPFARRAVICEAAAL